MDEQVGRLLAGVEERGLTDCSIIVFTADHGEGLGERDYWFAHGDYLTDPLVRIPLLIRVPGRPGDVRDDVVGLVDLLPTLLALIDAPDFAPPWPGRDFLSASGPEESSAVYLSTLGESSVLRRGLVVGDYVLEVSRQDDKLRAELHNRGNKEADLGEALPELAKGMLARLAKIKSGMQPREPQRREGVTKEDLARFKALGYVE
jgi:arylsulfatase A-like enzyme